MQRNDPLISVIMPVFNGENYLDESIKSILNQTYKNFELLIINDGSTDKSANIIKKYRDKRIILIDNENNNGNYHVRNQAMKLANGKYIAVMDCDDVALSARLEKQVKYLESNNKVGICGSFALVYGTQSMVRLPIGYEHIKTTFLSDNCLIHPTLMMRSSMVEKYNLEYDESYYFAADYDLLIRAASFFPVINIPEVLLMYRRHGGQISNAQYEKQQTFADQIRIKQLDHFQLKPDFLETKDHLCLIKGWRIRNSKEFRRIQLWANKLLDKNQHIGYYENDQLVSSLRNLLLKLRFVNNASLIDK